MTEILYSYIAYGDSKSSRVMTEILYSYIVSLVRLSNDDGPFT